MKKLNRGALFTDLHVGAKSNSEQHNDDCVAYINWFCDQVTADPLIDHVIFGGDWHEVRSAINIQTLKYSYDIATKLNDLGLPIYMIIGNHDLYHRNSRDIYSVLPFHEFENFTIISEPTVIDNIGNSVLLCPFLFHDEYSKLVEFSNVPIWVGHFEFKNFVVAGYNIKMKEGPDHTNFTKPKHIISGHFHKRQQSGNVTYIGNVFPTNFADAGDFERGMMVYDHAADDMVFFNWDDCPKYITTTLSELINDDVKLFPNARVKVLADVPVTFEETLELKKKFILEYNLREMTIEESSEIQTALSETTTDIDISKLASVDEMVVEMLDDIDSEHIDNKLLAKIYKKL